MIYQSFSFGLGIGNGMKFHSFCNLINDQKVKCNVSVMGKYYAHQEPWRRVTLGGV